MGKSRPRRNRHWQNVSHLTYIHASALICLCRLPIEWIFLNASDEQLLDSDYRRYLITALFSTKLGVQSCLALIRQIGHRLDTADALTARGLLSVLAALFNEAQSALDDQDIVSLKQLLFVNSGALKRLALAHNIDDRISTGLEELLQSSFRPTSSVDRHILSEVSSYWLALLLGQLSRGDLRVLDVSCLCKLDGYLDLIAYRIDEPNFSLDQISSSFPITPSA